MSWYDTAVKKMGFPAIELFVKVSNVVNVNFFTNYIHRSNVFNNHCQSQRQSQQIDYS